MTDPCTNCGRPLNNPVPEKWAQRYPDMAGMCRDCAFEWIAANLPEDREPEPTGGFLDGIKGACEK